MTLRVAATTSDDQAVGYYRVRGPLKALVDQGEVVEVQIPQLNIHCARTPTGPGRVTGVDAPDADVLILQRPTNWAIADSIPFFQEAGVAVVVDLDDDVEHTADKHAQRTVYDPRHNQLENWCHLKRACGHADLVVVSTEALRRYAPHGRVVVVRNLVSARYLGIPRIDDHHTVGWGGTVLNHPGDLQVTQGGVAAAMRETGWRFLVVGDGSKVRQNLNLDTESEKTDFVPIQDYPRHVSRFAVGIAPLEDGAFNEAKSALKLMEYAALGVPWVASCNTTEYRRFACRCDGELVTDRGRSWRSALLKLMRDPGLRVERSEQNRQVVAEHFTMEKESWTFAEAWQQAVVNHRAGMAA